MVIFHCYVSLPEGTLPDHQTWHENPASNFVDDFSSYKTLLIRDFQLPCLITRRYAPFMGVKRHLINFLNLCKISPKRLASWGVVVA